MQSDVKRTNLGNCQTVTKKIFASHIQQRKRKDKWT